MKILVLRISLESSSRDWLVLVVGALTAVRVEVSIQEVGSVLVILIHVHHIWCEDLPSIRRVAHQPLHPLLISIWLVLVAVHMLHLFRLSEVLVQALHRMWRGSCPFLAWLAFSLSRISKGGVDVRKGA